MHKIIRMIAVILCIMCIILSFTGCVVKDTNGQVIYSVTKEETEVYNNTYYTVIDKFELNSSCQYYIVYDNETKVMYHITNGSYNRGTLTMLVNADGTPKLYEDKE